MKKDKIGVFLGKCLHNGSDSNKLVWSVMLFVFTLLLALTCIMIPWLPKELSMSTWNQKIFNLPKQKSHKRYIALQLCTAYSKYKAALEN